MTSPFIDLTHAATGKKFKVRPTLIAVVLPVDVLTPNDPHDSSTKAVVAVQGVSIYYVRETVAAVLALIPQK